MNDPTARMCSSDWEKLHGLILRFDLIPDAFRSTLLNYSYSR
jgi:hypothetical protein